MKLWYNKSEKGDCDKRFSPEMLVKNNRHNLQRVRLFFFYVEKFYFLLKMAFATL